MHTRLVFLTGLALLFCAFLPATAQAGTNKVIHIKKGAAVVDDDTYPSLEAYRLALGSTAFPVDGMEIILYNDDDTLQDDLYFPYGVKVVLKSKNGIHTVSGTSLVNGMVDMDGDGSGLTAENIRFTGIDGPLGVITIGSTNDTTLSLKNTVIENNSVHAAIHLEGTAKASITNSIIRNSGVAFEANDYADLNIAFDRNAEDISTWTGNIALLGGGTIGVNVAEGKKFDLQGRITNADTVTKTGQGTWKVGGDWSGTLNATTLNIDEGRMHFEEGTLWSGGTVNVGSKGVLKISTNLTDFFDMANDPNRDSFNSNSSRFSIASLISKEGARTEIGYISKFTALPYSGANKTHGGTPIINILLVGTGNTVNSQIASSMNIDNKLMKATWKAGVAAEAGGGFDKPDGEKDTWMIHIERLNNLNVLDGVGSYADAYRMMDLSDNERDMLDTIYATGAAGNGLGFLQTIGGSIVHNALLAMRHNQANLVSKINTRLTKYQKEELALGVTGSELCNYSDYDPINEYGELWAFIDQTWMRQDDLADLAGYKYQTHTIGVGYDWHRDNMIWGGAASYSTGDMKLRNNSGTRNDIDNLMLAGYLSWAQEGWYISGTGLAGYGWNDATSKYYLPGLTAASSTGNYATSMLGANVEVGYMFETEYYDVPIRVTPYGSMTYARLHRNAVRESGSGSVNMDRQFRATNWNMWDAAIGARVSVPIDRCGYTLIPSLDVAWTRTVGETADGDDAWFVNRQGAGWSIPLMSKNRSSLRVSAGLDARVKENLSINMGYDFEWRDSYWRHQLNLGMSMGF